MFKLQFVGKSEKTDLNEQDIGKDHDLTFTFSNAALKIRHPISQWAVYILCQNTNHFIHYNTLCEQVMIKMKTNDRTLVKQTLNNDLNILRLVLIGMININCYPPNYSSASPISHKPAP